uniref:leucine-rich repeat receptor-like serine/threonine-protein kinase BAM3 n=1 Tax=Erigeron canadensis TaxID=72917 RepID=UPI001CB8A81D|nr:leucine-rich repeat receptor-like serine/threonine-protein kinase BAM3 [Erigeron canadensis]
MSSCRHFKFYDILSATQNFDESLVVGHGGFGKVYKGNIIMDESTSVVAAIKRLDTISNQGEAEFWAEVEILSKLRHCNLVSLIGYCNHGKEKILVYEYMPNGTLEDHLHKLGTPLSWLQRLKICIGAGHGLHYLHTGTGIESGVIHRDVKSSNILLHESWAAKISDFGLSRVGPTNQPTTYVNTIVKGTFGYLDPDYYATGKLTRKSDVYAFGVVMLELLCRKRALDRSLDEEQWNLARWVQEFIKEGTLSHIVDSDIRGEISPKCLKEFVQIVERCLYTDTKQRLTMAQVLVGLENILILQEKYNNNLLQPGGRKALGRILQDKYNNSLQFAGRIPLGRMLQEKYNNSLQFAGSTLLGRMVNMLSISSNGEHSGGSKLSSDNNISGENYNNTLLETIIHPAGYRISSLHIFHIYALAKSTNDFCRDKIIGEGDRGTTYLGWVDKDTFTPSEYGDRVAIAVKRLHNVQKHAEWEEEVSFLGQLDHPNIVTLLGYCNDESKQYLVYEYMFNRSLDRFIFTDIPNHIAKPLSWRTRLNIMIGVARGLVYLHSLNAIQRHLKSSKILLDKDFNAKLVCSSLYAADFQPTLPWNDHAHRLSYGTVPPDDSHQYNSINNSVGYIDPAIEGRGPLSVKSDIYSFGVVLLEALSGLRVIDEKRPTKKKNLVEWARPILEKRKKLKKIMDQRLEQNYPIEGAFDCTSLALRCLASSSKDRPSSKEVLQSLEQILSNSMTT